MVDSHGKTHQPNISFVMCIVTIMFATSHYRRCSVRYGYIPLTLYNIKKKIASFFWRKKSAAEDDS